jgi:CRP/FNR family transcriptional regulator, cyclic AMP receptor protein
MLINLLGYFAAALVLATFCARQMITLRSLAIVSNVAFIAYAYWAALPPILVLHVVMLPMNVMRLRQAILKPAAT